MSFTILKKNPTQGEITSSLTGSTGDGSGLNFDGSAGSIDIASPPKLGTKFSFEFVIRADSWGSNQYLIDFGTGGRFFISSESGNSYNLGIFSDSGSTASFGVAVLDDLKVHHLVVTVDGTSAVLYDNGNQVGTADINSPNIDSCSAAALGANFPADDLFFNGTVYRARFWNKVVDAKALFERADVDFADQYGSQTNKISAAVDKNWGTNQADSGNDANDRSTFNANYAWTVNGTSVVDISVASNVLTFSARYNKHGIYYNASLVAGKRQRITLNVTTVGTGEFGLYYYTGSAYALITTLVSGENSVEFVPTATNGYVYLGCTADHASAKQIVLNAASIANSIVLCGCVSDYELSANPLQSLTVQDRAGAADGTCSASGVTQVQKLVQGNLTSLAVGSAGLPAGVPADNHVFIGDTTTTPLAGADDLIIAKGSNDAGVTIRTATNATGQICFADGNTGNEQYRGFIGYAHGTDKLNLGSGGSTRLTIDSTGMVTVTNATEAKLRLQNTKDWGGSDSGNIGTLEFYTTDASGAGARVVGAVQCAQDAGSTAPNGELVLKTAAGGGSSAAAVERMRIDSSGNVKIGSSSAVDTQLSVECDTTGEAIGDGIRVQNAHGVNNDIAPVYFGVHGGTRRAKAAIGLKRTGSYGIGELRFAVDSNGDDEDVSFANDTKLTIGSTGLATFSNGITVKGANNWSHISSQDGQSVSIADDAQIQIADVEAGAMLVHVYDRGTGYGGLIFVSYAGAPVIVADPSGVFAVADTDNKYCVYKSSDVGSHDVFLKNRSGGTKGFSVLVTAAVLDDF